jgi:hypothetical protein
MYPQLYFCIEVKKYEAYVESDRICGLVVRVPGYRSRGPGSIPGATSRTWLASEVDL